MNLIAFIAVLAFAPPTASAVIQSGPLDPAGDNQPQLQAFFDSLPDGTTATLPAGTWKLNSLLRINHALTIQSADPANPTVLSGVGADGNRHVLEVGNYDTNVFVNGVKLSNLIVECAVTGTGIHNCVVVHGDNFVATNCIWRNSEHEGIVVHGDCLTAAVTDCTALNCGHGNASYTQSTAGFNSHAHPTIYTNCTADGCGQGFEVDGHGTVLDGCVIKNPPANVAPLFGINIGSTGLGVYDVTLRHCTTRGYDQAVVCSNGIGRLAKVNVDSCTFWDGCISFGGGIDHNTNAIDRIPPGPDTYGSSITNNLFVCTKQNGGVAGYNSGVADNGGVLGREPLTVSGNTLYFVGAGNNQVAPPLFVAGKVTAAVTFNDNRMVGTDSASGRGDLATFTLISNPAVPNMPTFSQSRNVVVKADGTERPVVVKIEGAP